VTPTRIVEALDELEDGDARFGLGLEATPIEQLAFERGEEALRHGVVVGVSDRPHRGANTRLPTSFAELDRGVLRAMIRMVDHAARPPLPQRHIEGVEHHLHVQGTSATMASVVMSRPATDAAPCSAAPPWSGPCPWSDRSRNVSPPRRADKGSQGSVRF